jgi:hypothetical protein
VTDITGTWLWNSQPVPAGDGEWRTDSRNWSGATLLNFASVDMDAQDASSVFMALQPGDSVYVVQANNSTNVSNYVLTDVATDNGDGTFSLPVTRTSGTGQASNNQPSACTFSVTNAPSDVSSARQCTDFDLVTGLLIHKSTITMQASASAIGPELAWCQWCHQIFVFREPTNPYNSP